MKRQNIFTIIAILLSIAAGFLIGFKSKKTSTDTIITTKLDTLFLKDTIFVSKPQKETKRKISDAYIPVVTADTVILHDTTYIILPVEQLIWEDSLSTVYVSGINPKVDSILHYTNTAYITKEITKTITKNPKFSISIQTGIGAQYGIIHKQPDFGPYIGVGLSYRILPK